MNYPLQPHSCMSNDCHARECIVRVTNAKDTWLCTESGQVHHCKCDSACEVWHPDPRNRSTSCCYISRFEISEWVAPAPQIATKKQRVESEECVPDLIPVGLGLVQGLGQSHANTKTKRVKKAKAHIDTEIEKKRIVGKVVNDLLNGNNRRKSVNDEYEKRSAETSKNEIYQLCKAAKTTKVVPTWGQMDAIICANYLNKKWLDTSQVGAEIIEYYTEIVREFLLAVEKWCLSKEEEKTGQGHRGQKDQKYEKFKNRVDLQVLGALYLLAQNCEHHVGDSFLAARLPAESELNFWPPFSATQKTHSVKYMRMILNKIPSDKRKNAYAPICNTFIAYKNANRVGVQSEGHFPFIYLFDN